MNGKALAVLNPGLLVEIISEYGIYSKRQCRQCRSEFPRRGSKTNYEVMYLIWVMVFLRLRRKIDNWKIYHRPIVAVYMKILLLSVWKESITENFAKRNFGSQRSCLGISAHFEEKTIYYITIPLRHRKLIHKKVPYLL